MFENNDRYKSQMEKRPSSMDYARGRQGRDGGEGFFCRFTFGQFFALLVLEVFTIFFVFYLGARYGPKLLGLQEKGPIVVGEKTTNKVLTTDDPEVAAMAKDIVSKILCIVFPMETGKLKDILQIWKELNHDRLQSHAGEPNRTRKFQQTPLA